MHQGRSPRPRRSPGQGTRGGRRAELLAILARAVPPAWAGRKHERALEMADWQRQIVEQHPEAFLRGLFHSEGCRARNWASRTVAGVRKRYYYPRWQFTNESEDTKRWCGEALDPLAVPWRQSNRKTLSVSTREGVRMLDEHIALKC